MIPNSTHPNIIYKSSVQKIAHLHLLFLNNRHSIIKFDREMYENLFSLVVETHQWFSEYMFGCLLYGNIKYTAKCSAVELSGLGTVSQILN